MIAIIKKLLSDKSKNVLAYFSNLSDEDRKMINESAPADINTDDIVFDNKMNILKETFGISRNLPLNSQIKKPNSETQVKIQNLNHVENRDNNSNEGNGVKNNDSNSDNEDFGLSYKSQNSDNNNDNKKESEDNEDDNLGSNNKDYSSNLIEEDEDDNLAANKDKPIEVSIDANEDGDSLLKANDKGTDDFIDDTKDS